MSPKQTQLHFGQILKRTKRKIRFILIFLCGLLIAHLLFSLACGLAFNCEIDSDCEPGFQCNLGIGECEQETDARKLEGLYRSTQKNSQKQFKFAQKDYRFYFSNKAAEKQNPTLQAEYEIQGQNIIFKQMDGEEFIRQGVLSKDLQSFTWEEHPGEVFQKEVP